MFDILYMEKEQGSVFATYIVIQPYPFLWSPVSVPTLLRRVLEKTKAEKSKVSFATVKPFTDVTSKVPFIKIGA